jgi:hypothetical protein
MIPAPPVAPIVGHKAEPLWMAFATTNEKLAIMSP